MRLPLSIRLRYSRSAAFALILVSGLAGAAIAVCLISLAVKVVLSALLAFSTVKELRLHAWRRSGNSVAAFTLLAGNKVELEFGNGSRIETTIDTSSTVLHWLIVLRLNNGRRHYRLPLLPDTMAGSDFRQLQIWLRAHRPQVATEGGKS